jgi:hypothetical protein
MKYVVIIYKYRLIMLYLSTLCSRNLMKGRKIMRYNNLTDDTKSFINKVLFFVTLLVFSGLIYLERGLIHDAVYFIIVLFFFIKFLIMKLYH